MLQMKNAASVTDALRVMVQAEALSSEDGSKLTALVQQSQSATDEDCANRQPAVEQYNGNSKSSLS